MPTITHPPLTRAQHRDIVRRTVAGDLAVLLREIERLKALERLVWIGLTAPAEDPQRRGLRQRMAAVMRGELTDSGVYGVPSERKPSKQTRQGERAVADYKRQWGLTE